MNMEQKKILSLSWPVLLLLILLGLASCQDKSTVDTSDIKIESEFLRFDQAFFESDTLDFENSLAALKQAYPPFFSGNSELIFWKNQRTDPVQLDLYQAVEKTFGKLEKENALLNEATKRYYHYFGIKDTLKFYAYISRLDYQYPVLFADSLCFAGLDMYLGAESKFYGNTPNYLRYERQPRFLIRDCLAAMAQAQVPPLGSNPSLLETMLFYGKALYALELLMPDLPKPDLFKYPLDKYQFCLSHEKEMWVFFIQQQVLFKTTPELQRRFIETAPFSKFRTKLDAQTPGKVGRWFGYKIIKAYAEAYPELDLSSIMRERDAQKILKLSGYKP
jgi:hypothetical protein